MCFNFGRSKKDSYSQNGVLGVEIRRVTLPTFFDITSNASLLLDCDYVYNQNDIKLVVRWFYNNSQEPVYQWIPERNIRHIADRLKPSFDEAYESNLNDPYSRYRAIRIKNPTPDLSGKYVCDISSFASQDKREVTIFIYASPRTFEFRHSINKESGDLDVECTATGVYPLPRLTLWQQDSSGGSAQQPLTKGVESIVKRNRSLYDVTLKYTVTQKYIVSATVDGHSTKFECVLEIPEAHISKKRRISYSTLNSASLTDGSMSQTSGGVCLLAFLFLSSLLLPL
jgi:hypothetical protein